MNNVDQELWTNEEFFNPFGPNILRLKINEDTRLKILDSISICLNSHEPMRFGSYINNAVKNSIVNGKIGEVTKERQEKDYGKIIKNIIENLLCRYGELYYNRPCMASIKYIWYVVMKSGDFHLLHAHNVRTDIPELSGAIYLEIPDNLPEPQGNIHWVMGGVQGQLYNSSWECSPELGDVFLWPSWLQHVVYPFRIKQERIMISFNGDLVCR